LQIVQYFSQVQSCSVLSHWLQTIGPGMIRLQKEFTGASAKRQAKRRW